MESPLAASNPNDVFPSLKDKESIVDPFLVEALQNPRHRLTILRMELDIQRFLQNPEQQHFEFQHFPTSYLRLAAHRVAQHYGLPTMVQDNASDGQGNKIVVRKLAEIKHPLVRLSEIPAKQLENDKPEQMKIAIRRRPNKSSMAEANEAGVRNNPVRSVEERKEEYDRARARIFNSTTSSAHESLSHGYLVGKINSVSTDESEGGQSSVADSEKIINERDDAPPSRVAIIRDREKDRSDPDYDRSYGRYLRNIPTQQSFSLAPYSVQKVQTPYAQYDTCFPQLCQMPQTQGSLGYGPVTASTLSPYCAVGLNQTTGDAAYMQWPSSAMMYAQSYDQFRHAVFQAPFGQQPLSFDHLHNY